MCLDLGQCLCYHEIKLYKFTPTNIRTFVTVLCQNGWTDTEIDYSTE